MRQKKVFILLRCTEQNKSSILVGRVPIISGVKLHDGTVLRERKGVLTREVSSFQWCSEREVFQYVHRKRKRREKVKEGRW